MARIYFKNREIPLYVAESSKDVCDAMGSIKTGDKTYVNGLTCRAYGSPVFFILEEVQYITE